MTTTRGGYRPSSTAPKNIPGVEDTLYVGQPKTDTIDDADVPEMHLNPAQQMLTTAIMRPGWMSTMAPLTPYYWNTFTAQGFIPCRVGDGELMEGFGLIVNSDAFSVIENPEKTKKFYSPDGTNIFYAATCKAHAEYLADISRPRAYDGEDASHFKQETVIARVVPE